MTYGPAKAAPANRKGDAATAAIVDLIDILFYSISQAIKNLRMEILSTKNFTFYAGARSFDPVVICNGI